MTTTTTITPESLLWPSAADLTSAEIERAEAEAVGRARLLDALRREVAIEMDRVRARWNSETWADLTCEASIDRLLHRVHTTEPYVSGQRLTRDDAWQVVRDAWCLIECCLCSGRGCRQCAGLGHVPNCSEAAQHGLDAEDGCSGCEVRRG